METEQKETPEQQLFERGILPEDFISSSTYGAVVKIQKQNADLLSRVEELEKENELLNQESERFVELHKNDGHEIDGLTEQVEKLNKELILQQAIVGGRDVIIGKQTEQIKALTEQVEELKEERSNHYGNEYSMADWYQMEVDKNKELTNELAALRDKERELVEGIQKFVFHWHKYFNAPKVGQPPLLSDLEYLLSKYTETK